MTEMIPTGEQLKPDNLSDAIKTYPIKDKGDTSPAQQDDQALKDEGPKQNNKLFAAWNFAKKNFDNVPDNIRDFQDDLSTPAKLRVLKKGMSKNFDNLPDEATFANELGVSSSYVNQTKDALSNLEKNWKTLDLPVQQDNGKKVYNTETMGYDNALPTKEQLQSQINYSDAIKTYPIIVNQENSADVLKNNKSLIQGFMNHFALLRPQDREAVLGSVDAMNIPQETKDFLKDEAPRLVDQRNEELAQIAKDTGEVSYNGFWKNISHDLHKAAQGFENSLLGVGLMPTIHKILNPFSVDLSQEMMSRLNNFSQYQIDPRDEADIASQLSGKPKSAGLELQEGISNQVAPITEMAITAALLPQMPLPRVIEGAGAAAKIMNLLIAYTEHGLKFGLPMQEAATLFHGKADFTPLMEGLVFGSATKMTHSLINGALIDKLTSTGVPTRVARAFIEATSTALGGTAAATGIAAANGETVDGKFIRDQVVTLGALGMWGGVMGNASRKNFISGVVKDLADRGDISQAWVEPLIESAIKNTDPGTIKKTIQDYKVAVDKLKIAMHYVADDPNHPLNESVRKVLDGNDLSYDQYKDLTTIVDQTTTRYETAQARERADKFEKQSNSKLASDTEDLGASSDDIIKQIKDETGIGGGSSKTTPIENTIARISDIENGRPLNVTGGYRDENGELVLKLSSPHTNSEYEVFANSKNLQLRKVKDNGAETKQSESGDILKGDKIDAASKEIEEVQGENRQAEQGGIELSEHDRTVGSTLEEPNPIDELAGRMNKYPDIRSRLEDVISGKFDLETKNWAREVIKRADELKQEEKEYVARQEAKRESKYRAIEENLKKDADFANNQRFQTPTSLDVHKDIAKELTGDEVDYLRSIARGNEDARRILDEYDKINGDKEKLKDAKLDELADKNKDNPDMISAYERLAKSGSKDAQTVLDKIKKLNEGKDDVIQQIESFGVPKDQVEPVHNVISQMFQWLKKTGLTASKTVGDWVGIGKGEEKPYSLKINGKDVQVKNVSPDVVNGFYSPLEKTINEFKGDKLPAKQWADKFKGEEAKWTGLKDWLAQQQGSVSKADIQKFLKDKNNRIKIVEKVKSDENLFEGWNEEEVRDYYEAVYLDESDLGSEGMSRQQMINDMRYRDADPDFETVDSGIGGTHHSRWQLEGEKEHYKEILVMQLVGKNAPSRVTSGFMTGHWPNEPDILVHLRMNTRIDAEGKKVVFLEEIQSDHGEQGRMFGFKGSIKELPKGYTIKPHEDRPFIVYDENNKAFAGGDTKEEATGTALSLLNSSTEMVPSAPFVTDTNAWTKLGLKVALKEAVKQRADKLAWTTGEQQNERWSLSKQVDEIRVVNNGDGTFGIYGVNDSKIIVTDNAVPKSKLADTIGKDLASKIEGDNIPNQEGKVYKGDDLKIVGNGMKGFYGSATDGSLGIVGNVAKALTKQEPKPVKFITDKTKKEGFDKGEIANHFIEVKNNEPGVYELSYRDNEGRLRIEYYLSPAKAESRARELPDELRREFEMTQHSIDITSELIAQVEGGQPLFKDAEAQYRIESGKNIVEALKDFNGSQEATVALTHEIIHPTMVAIIDGAKEGNEAGVRHTKTIVDEFNKATGRKLTTEDLIKDNDAFKGNKTSGQYRAVQEFIAKSWEKYHREGGRGFSEAFQKVLDHITQAFGSVYKSISGKELTPKLREMFDEILGKEQTLQAEGKEQTLRAEGKETLPYKSERELASERGNQGDIVTGGNTPLGRLTEKVKGAPPRKFFDNMKEYFKNEWKALPTESSFKDVIDLAKSNINTFVKFSIERMRGLDKYGTWEQLIGERQYQQQLANSDQYDFVKNTLSRFTHDEMEPIGSYIQAGGDAESLGRSFQKTGLRKYKDAMNLTQEQKDMADHVSKMFDEQFDYLSKNDVLKSHLENYIRRSYEKNPDIVKNFSAELNSSIYTGKPGFSKKRVFEMDSDAEAEGMKLKPFLTRIVEYNYDAIKAVSDRAFVKGLNDRLEADGRPTVDIGGVDQPLYELQFDANDLASMEKTATFIHPKWRPSDTNPLNDRSDYVRYEHPSFRAFKYLMKDADGKPVFYQGDMLVHKDAIKRIRNLFDASPFETSPILKGVLHTMGVMKETMLDLSGFHAVQIGVHAAEHRVNPFAKHAFDLKNDKELIELVKHGMVLFDTRKQGLFQDGWSGASLVRKIPFLRTVSQTMGDFTFKEYIPRIKTAMAKDALERNRSRYPSLSEDQLYSLTAKQANAAFGGQNYEMMGRSKMWQDFSRILIAPDFFESRVKFVGQALTGFGGEQRTALMLGAVGMYVTARAINGALNDGDMHTEPENMFSVVYKGRAYSLRTIQGDLAHLYNDPSSFMFSRIHPLFSATGQKLLNRDPYGRKVTYEDMIRKMVPIPTGLSGLTEPEKTIYESFFRSFGITNKRWNEIDEVNRFAKKFKEDNGIKEKGEFIYDPDADRFRNFKVALRYGNDHDVEDAIKDGVKSGVFKEYELFTLMSRMKNSHFTDGKLEPKFLKSLDSEQRLKYNEALLEKQYLFNRFRKIINKE